MLRHFKYILFDFYKRNLFERIIIYVFISMLVSKAVFELVMGQWHFAQSQNQQWIFFSLLAFDYLISFKKVINMRITVNPMSLFSLLFFVMVAQGLFVGIVNGNAVFKIFNDTVPLLIIALNILRMQSYSEIEKPIDFKFLLYSTTLLTFTICILGHIAHNIGNPSVATIAAGQIYFPIFFTALFVLRPFPKTILVAFLIMVVIAITEINRSTMLFIILIIVAFAGIQIIKSPSKGVFVIIAAIVACSAFWIMLPKDSKTYQRIIGITELDLSSRTGAVGERQAEQDAVSHKIDLGGKTTQWTGLGFGGTYNVQFTHKYLVNYGHAHYSWVWFNLRFGYMGYIYMIIFASIMLFNAFRSVKIGTDNGVLVALLCISGIIYMMTYVNAIFLSSGIHFLYLHNKNDKQKAEEPEY